MAHLESGWYEYEEPQMEKKTIEALWKEFGKVCTDEDECIDSSFCGWERDTDVHDVWHWFDAQYAKWGGVAALMYPERFKKSKYGRVGAHVNLQVWVHDYAFEVGSAEFDCGRALDMLPLEMVKKLVAGRAGYDTDEVFAMAVIMNMVDDHDGPFDCYICDDDELAEYIKAREEKERE